MGLLFGGVLVLSGTALFVDDALATAIGLVFYVLVIVGYPVAFETFTRGRSLGKMAIGLRVVREDGGPERFRHAFVRGLLGVVEIWLTFGSVALIASLASAKGRRIGDYLAGTVVVHERVPVRAAPIATMPPQLAGWAQQLDLSRVPDDLALAARQFLGRAPELSPQVREEMGTSLARALAAVTAPPPPPAYRPGRSCRRCWPSGGAARCCGSAAAPPTYGGWPGPPPPPPPSVSAAAVVRRHRCQRPSAGAACGRPAVRPAVLTGDVASSGRSERMGGAADEQQRAHAAGALRRARAATA